MSPADWLRLLTLSVLWGGSFFFVQLAVPFLPALTLVWLRVSLAAALLGAALPALGVPYPSGASAWRALLVMGGLNNALPFTCFVLAQSAIPSGLAAILNATTPLFTLLAAAALTADEKLSAAKIAGLAAGLAGVVVLTGGGRGVLWAEGLCLLAALSYAFAFVWGKRFRPMGLAPLSTAFGMLVSASALLLPLVILRDRPWSLRLPPAEALAAVAGLAVLSTALAYILYFRILAGAGAVNLSLVTFLIPVSAILLGTLLLGERLDARHLAGMALIALGLLIIDGKLWRRLLRT